MNVSPALGAGGGKASFSGQEPVAGMDRPARRWLAPRRGWPSARDSSSAGAAPPIRTAWSARVTCSRAASASEYTATVSIPMTRHVRRIRTAISPRLATRIRVNTGHPEDAEAGRRESARYRPPRAPAERVARVQRVDDAVVPQPRGGVVGGPFALVFSRIGSPDLRVFGLAERASLAGQLIAFAPCSVPTPPARPPSRRMRALGPHPQEARVVGAPAHAVVAGAELSRR
jgi:hypothetical protein